MQESNSFLLDQDGIEHFENYEAVLLGDQLLAELDQRNDEIRGFVDALRTSPANLEIVPVLSASGHAGGLLTAEAVRHFTDIVRSRLQQAGHLDGFLFALHGSMASADDSDLEGYFLDVVRQTLGPDIPIVASLDMHAVVTDQMLAATTAIVAYRTHPHVDLVQTGQRAGGILLGRLTGRTQPVMACQKIPLLLPPPDDGTNAGALSEIMDLVNRSSERKGVLDCSLCTSYPWLDAEQQGWAVLAVTDARPELGRQMVTQIADQIWQQRRRFLPEPMLPPVQAVQAVAVAPGSPIIVTDSADTCGGGGPGDTTSLLQALLAERHKTDGLLLLHMTDAKAIEDISASDVGAAVTINVGNVGGIRFGGLVSVTGNVLKVTEGAIEDVGNFGTQRFVDPGKIVCLAVDNLRLVVTQRGTIGPQPSLFRKVDIEPFDAKIVALKTGVGFKATYGHVAQAVFRADCPGVVSYNPANFTFKRTPPTLFPLDPHLQWTSD